MNPETVLNILAQCAQKVPQHVMVWDAKEHCFRVYVSPKKEN